MQLFENTSPFLGKQRGAGAHQNSDYATTSSLAAHASSVRMRKNNFLIPKGDEQYKTYKFNEWANNMLATNPKYALAKHK